jgi:TRAP-type C4-dicarboxylate transport system permease small subunit
MAEQASSMERPTDPVGRILYDVCRWLAIFGGLLSCAMAAIVTISVTGRYLFAAPVPGDYDIVGIICGNAIFAFLPYCQFMRGNIIVDFFTNNVPARGKALLDAVGTFLYLVIAILFTWRMYYGMLELRASNEVIAAFNFYRWWTVPLNIVCMIVLIATVAYTFVRDVRNVQQGRLSERTAVHGE